MSKNIKLVSLGCAKNLVDSEILIGGLKKADIHLNRKMLAQLAVVDPKSFSDIVGSAKS